MDDARIKAKSAGLIRFTGQPCAACGQPERYVRNGKCARCVLAHTARWLSNQIPEHRRLYHAEWKKRNPKKIQGYAAKHWNENKERLKPQHALWRKEHVNEKKAMNASWRERNPERARAYSANRRAANIRATPVYANLESIQQIYNNCPHEAVVDHVIPLRGKIVSGFHIETNLQYLTRSENAIKRNRFQPIFTSAFSDSASQWGKLKGSRPPG